MNLNIKTTIKSESGIFCNDKKKIISDKDECDGIYRLGLPNSRGIRGEWPRELKICKFCQEKRNVPTWGIPKEIQKYFPIKNED